MTDSFNIIMNPPYDGSLHLKILEKALTFKSDNGTCVCLSPARWIVDPLWKYKKNSNHEKYQETIVNKISDLAFINNNIVCNLFKIGINGDLCIYIFNNKSFNKKLYNNIAELCINKILSSIKISIADKEEKQKINGWRSIVYEMLPCGFKSGNAKLGCCTITNLASKGVFHNGLDKQGNYWTTHGINKQIGDMLPHSIEFASELEANNFSMSCRTNFYKNFVYLIKFGMNAPLRFIPYMGDYSHVWTDEDYCKFFNLTKEESEFMCRKVDDYRVKDFINYEEIY